MSNRNYSNGPGATGTVIEGGDTFSSQVLKASWLGNAAAGDKLGPISISATPQAPVMVRVSLTGVTDSDGLVPTFVASEILFVVTGTQAASYPIGDIVALLIAGSAAGVFSILLSANATIAIHFSPAAPQAGVTLAALLETVPMGN
jgi:hypothetical protein